MTLTSSGKAAQQNLSSSGDLECIKDNFLIRVLNSLTKGEALLHLLLTNVEELILVAALAAVITPW